MSGNIGLNIWTTGDALQNPELDTSPANTSLDTLVNFPALVFAGDALGASVSTNFAVEIETFLRSPVSTDINIPVLVFAGDVAGSVNVSIPVTSISGSDYTPSIQGVSTVFPAIIAAGGYAWGTGGLEPTVAIDIFAGDVSGSVDVNIPVRIGSYALPETETHGIILLSGLAAIVSELQAFDVVEASEVAATELMIIVRSAMEANENLTVVGELLNIVGVDQAVMRAAAIMPYMLELADSFEADTSTSVRVLKIIEAIDEVVAEDDSESRAALYVALAAAVVATDRIDNVLYLDVQSTLEALCSFELELRTVLAIVDSILASVSVGSYGFFVVESAENIEALDGGSSVATLLQAIAEDSLQVQVSIRIGEDVYEGWVVNTESQAFSQYENFRFNSLLQAEGRFFGIAEDGLYELVGDDDAGTPIDASFRTGLLDFGSHYLKDVKSLHLGYTSAGKLVLKVATTAKGQKEEWWYELKQGASSSMRDGRFTIGRGLRAKYWQFEVANKDGDDFEVDDIQIMYNILSRRIR